STGRKEDIDVSNYGDWLTVNQMRSIFALLDRIDGSSLQQRMTTDSFCRTYGSIGRDDCLHFYKTLCAGRLSYFRIDCDRCINHEAFGFVGVDPDLSVYASEDAYED